MTTETVLRSTPARDGPAPMSIPGPLAAAPPAVGPRQIVICCDGTNNTLTAGRADTHVLRVYEHLRRHPAPERLLFYDPGVGSPAGAPPTGPADWLMRTAERLSSLASGRGIYANVAEAYLFLVRHYRGPEDQIYLFGFSRGAFTARCVAGMVNLFGIIGRDHEVMLPTLIRVYFSLPDDSKLDRGSPVRAAMRRLNHVFSSAPVGRDALARQIVADFTDAAGRDAVVHWVGVWDTVESVGLPGPLSRSNPSSATVHDKRFRHVRHAIAFDEHRWTFEPRLYEEPGDIDDRLTPQTLKQRWFPGAHCDVGGGYSPEHSGLGEATFVWMVDEAIACGLAVPAPVPRPVGTLRHDALWDSPWWALAGMVLRDMRPSTADGQAIAVVAGPTIPAHTTSAWHARRSVPALWAALLLGLFCLQRAGATLRADGWGTLVAPETWWPHTWNAIRFAQEQLVGPLHGPRWLTVHYDAAPVFWSMCWDFGFIACWGYLLARVASHAFSWLAGRRAPGKPLPPWRALGFAPLLAVGGDVGENLLTLAAFAAQGAGAESWTKALLLLTSLAATAKYVGLVGSVPLLLVRLWISLPGVAKTPTRRAV